MVAANHNASGLHTHRDSIRNGLALMARREGAGGGGREGAAGRRFAPCPPGVVRPTASHLGAVLAIDQRLAAGSVSTAPQ
jgi:hypothetical protein